MELSLDQSSPHFPRILTAKTSITSSVFATQTKIDETMLRAKQNNKFDELLRIVKQERERLAQLPGASTLDEGVIEASPARPN